MSSHPIGSTWELRKDGRIGKIWFAEISDYGYEIWRWSVAYEDGSGRKFDWGTSYAICKRTIPMTGRFKKLNSRQTP